ncbi:hypothetical protein [Halosolutus gelatinilyticus]|uniref:hypothetical protein n=1 Tax=Halosolutus gelatinilyticus TaxID=2931975 RepID=UPI001FF634ED|nr:hypothetical protein [Halosolutus gelatinilyticus]
MLILLDTCRVDALREVAPEYEFIPSVESILSTGGASAEWLARTFDEQHRDEIADTAFLSAQNHVQQILDTNLPERDSDKPLPFKALRFMPSVDLEDVGKVEYIFRYEPVGEEGPYGHPEGSTPPRYVTDRGIQVGRREEYDRLILQYHQPHTPWFSTALEEDRDLKYHERDWWNYYMETGDVDTIWDAYMSDLRYVLDDIELLLRNIDAETVAISSDHGEAFGEYGILGHTLGSLHPKVRKVPWVETTATDEGSYEPSIDEPSSERVPREKLDEQLKALGYR